MAKGIMQWKYPDLPPKNQGFVYYLINDKSNPKNPNPYFGELWSLGAGAKRGIYQFPVVNAKHSVADNVSFMQYFLSSLAGGINNAKDMPIMFLGLYLSLDQINEYLGYLKLHIYGENAGWPKPLIYLTPENWASKLKGENFELVAKNIVDQADICLSDWKCTLPGKVYPWDTVRGWEYGTQATNGGLLQYDPDGVFLANENPLPPTDPVDPPVDDPDNPPVTGAASVVINVTGNVTVNQK